MPLLLILPPKVPRERRGKRKRERGVEREGETGRETERKGERSPPGSRIEHDQRKGNGKGKAPKRKAKMPKEKV